MRGVRAGVLGLTMLALGACGGTTRTGGTGTGSSTSGFVGAPGAGVERDVVVSNEAWTFDRAEGRLITTAHYRVFTTEKEPITISRLPRFLELALDHYRSAIVPLPAPPVKLDVFLMDNRDQWKRLTLQMMGREGERYHRIGRGGFAHGGRAFLWDIGVFDTLAIAAHEGWHQYTQRTFRDPLPIYMEEGLASFMEGHRWAGNTPVFLPWSNLERYDRLRTAHARRELVPLSRLLSEAPQDLLAGAGDEALRYYAQVWALMHFLNEGEGGAYREGLRNLLLDAEQGKVREVVRVRFGERGLAALSARRGSLVLEAYLPKSLEEVDREYGVFVSRLVAAGSRDRIVQGQSPNEKR